MALELTQFVDGASVTRSPRRISVMILRRYRYAVAFAIATLLTASHAGAFTITLGGPEPESASPSTNLTSTIWAGATGGALVKHAGAGETAQVARPYTA